MHWVPSASGVCCGWVLKAPPHTPVVQSPFAGVFVASVWVLVIPSALHSVTVQVPAGLETTVPGDSCVEPHTKSVQAAGSHGFPVAAHCVASVHCTQLPLPSQ